MWCIVFTALLAATPADPPLPNPYSDVAPERNAWTQLHAAIGLMVKGVDLMPDYPSFTNPLRPALMTYIANNRAALERFDAAIASPEMALSPADLNRVQVGADDRFGTYSKIRELTRMKVQRAYQRQAQGDRAGAANDACDLLRFEQLWNRGCESVIGLLVARAGIVRSARLRQLAGATTAERVAGGPRFYGNVAVEADHRHGASRLAGGDRRAV